jgi:DNA-binding GntR family transcriptional regulator
MVAGEQESSLLAPVISSTRREVVVEALRRAVLAGELAAGQRIKESHMADLLGVSRPTIREAMGQLIHEGLLVQEPYKGFRVAHPSPEELLDVAEVRVSLETQAALRLARDPGGERMAALRAALEVHLRAIETGDKVQIHLTHLDFHRTLWEASGNTLLVRIWPLCALQIQAAMGFDQVTINDPGRDAALHLRLVEVIASGDEAEIREEVRQHIVNSADRVIELTDRKRRPKRSGT